MSVNANSVGVIVGRFQVPMLHQGHRYLVESALRRHDEVCIVLGTTKAVLVAHSPLSADVRRVMLQNAFPGVVVLELRDQPSDEAWSASLDALIGEVFPNREATLYGSRGSFIPHYHGRLKTVELKQIYLESGTAMRQASGETILDSPDFRRGIIHAAHTRIPLVYPTVDIVALKPETREALLGRRTSDGGKWRFIGGFVDPEKDDSIEAAARREFREEAGVNLEVGPYTLLGTTRIDDPRYRGTGDSIITSFFKTERVFGSPTASDDIEEVAWFAYDKVGANLVDTHLPLGGMFNRLIRDVP